MRIYVMSELIDPHIRWLVAAGMSPRTIGERDRILHAADAELPFGLEAATSDDVTGWFAARRWGVATRSTYDYHLRAWYGWAVRGGHLTADPMLNVRRPRTPRGRPRPVRPEVLADVLTRAANPWRLHVLLAAAGGLRCCEIAGLHREDIDARRILIRHAKGGDEQSVPTHPAIWEEVRDYPPGSVVKTAGGRADPAWVSIQTALYFRRQLGLPGVALHRFRHTYGSMLRRQGHDLFMIKELMRHRSIASTQVYVEVGDEERSTAIATLPIPAAAA